MEDLTARLKGDVGRRLLNKDVQPQLSLSYPRATRKEPWLAGRGRGDQGWSNSAMNGESEEQGLRWGPLTFARDCPLARDLRIHSGSQNLDYHTYHGRAPDIPQNPQTSVSTISTLHPINVAMISVTEQACTKLKGGKERIPVFPAWVQGEQLPLALDCLPTHSCLVGRLAETQPHPAWSMFDLDPGLMVMVGLDM